MALTGIAIFKFLPKTNCKECGFPTCLAFAMKLAAKQVELDKCPYVSDEARGALSEASAPPIKGITIGTGDKKIKIGEETVLFRHEKTFANQPAVTILLDDSLSDDEISAKVEKANAVFFERVGQIFRVDLLMVRNASGNAARYGEVVKLVKSKTDIPLILASENVDAIKAGVEVAGSDKPLLHAATEDNFEAMAAIAKEGGCPLVISSNAGLETLSALAEKVAGLGVKDLVLDPGSHSMGNTLALLTQIRRAALKKTAAGLGYPVFQVAATESGDEVEEASRAAMLVAKYASIIVLKNVDNHLLLPLYTMRQNIYTDPQQPLQVKEDIYKIGEPDENSPILVTTNFSLTYFIVSGEVESSKVSAWLVIVDAEGMSVLTAWAADKFNPTKIAKAINGLGVKDKVATRELIIPGYVAVLSGELKEVLPEWEISVGPREAGNLGNYLRNK